MSTVTGLLGYAAVCAVGTVAAWVVLRRSPSLRRQMVGVGAGCVLFALAAVYVVG